MESSPVERRIRRLLKVDLVFTVLALVFHLGLIILVCIYLVHTEKWQERFQNKYIHAAFWMVAASIVVLRILLVIVISSVLSVINKIDSEPLVALKRYKRWMYLNIAMIIVSLLNLNLVGILYNGIVIGRSVFLKNDLETQVRDTATRQKWGL